MYGTIKFLFAKSKIREKAHIKLRGQWVLFLDFFPSVASKEISGFTCNAMAWRVYLTEWDFSTDGVSALRTALYQARWPEKGLQL